MPNGSIPLENMIKEHTGQFRECVFSSLREKKSRGQDRDLHGDQWHLESGSLTLSSSTKCSSWITDLLPPSFQTCVSNQERNISKLCRLFWAIREQSLSSFSEAYPAILPVAALSPFRQPLEVIPGAAAPTLSLAQKPAFHIWFSVYVLLATLFPGYPLTQPQATESTQIWSKK